MAFTLQNWCRASASANEPLVTLADATISGCFREYNYHTADTQAVASAASYFDTVNYDLTSGDYVNVYSSTDDSLVKYKLTNTAGVITAALEAGRIQAQVAFTAAEINGMYAAPKLLLPAPGANRMYIFEALSMTFTYGAAQFANGGVSSVQYGATANGAGVLCSAGLAAALVQGVDANETLTYIPQALLTNQANAAIVNAGLYLSNVTAAFDTGDSTAVANILATVVATA